ncbi:hypothetical protein [Isoptericola hypogeus]
MLAGAELPQVQAVRSTDVRAVAEHKAPGKDGSMLQNLGRAPTALTVHGVATDPAALDLVSTLKDRLRTGDPVEWVADITTDTSIEQVLVDDLQVRQLAGRPDRYAYTVTLREYLEPVAPAPVDPLGADILADAAGLTDGLLEGLDLALPFSTGLESFVTPLTELLGRLRQANAASG